MDVSLALGSGAARGLAHIGVLKVFEENGITVREIAGTSIGSIIGGLYSQGYSAVEMEKIALENSIFDYIRMADFQVPPSSAMLKGKKVQSYIETLFGDKTFADTKIPFKAVATNILNGKETVFNSGKLSDVIMCSISIPGIFPPFEYQGTYFVDGALTNPVPIDILELKNTIKVGVDVTPKHIYHDKEDIKSLMKTSNILMQSFAIMEDNIVERKMGNFDNIVIIKPVFDKPILYHFHKAKYFISKGEEATRKILDYIV